MAHFIFISLGNIFQLIASDFLIEFRNYVNYINDQKKKNNNEFC